jgi:hypothetical protein
MPTQPALSTLHITADSPKGQKAVEVFRAQYNKAMLNDDEAQNLNEHPGWAAYLAAGIRKFSAKGPVFPAYLEIEVGGKTRDQLLVELKSEGHQVSDYAKDLMSKEAWRPGQRQVVKFARVTVRELGFAKNPTTREIWARIQELGHSLCEPGDGPAIRLVLKDQPRGDYFWIAMEQIAGSDGSPNVFDVKHADGSESWLFTIRVGPDREWGLDFAFVFRLRK